VSGAFTHYWNNETWQALSHQAGQPLDHVSSNMFAQRGVEVGDRVYVVTVVKGVLHLLGRLVVGDFLDRDEAEEVIDEPWDACDHLVASECTPMDFTRTVTHDLVERLQFESIRGITTLKFKNGGLDEQTLRGVRRLTEESASLLDDLLADAPTLKCEWPAREPADEPALYDLDPLGPVRDYFDEQEYAYDLDEDDDILSTFEVDDAQYSIALIAAGGLVVCFIHLPLDVAEDEQGIIAETLMRANRRVLDSVFFLEYEEGEVCLRTIHPPSEAPRGFEKALLRAVVYNAIIGEVIEGELTPTEAVEQAESEYEEELDGTEADDLDDETAPG
jgi:hypothetical protein